MRKMQLGLAIWWCAKALNHIDDHNAMQTDGCCYFKLTTSVILKLYSTQRYIKFITFHADLAIL